MKLDFEIDAAETAFFSDGEFSGGSDSSHISDELRAGIEAARGGERARARVLLVQASQIEPESEEVWMWLASVSEYPEELLVFLERALRINPRNKRALQWARETKSLMSQTFVERGVGAANGNQNAFARQCFHRAILQNGENETAWLHLASASETDEEKHAHLLQVLSLNPENETAAGLLAALKKQAGEQLLPQAFAEVFAGDYARAQETLGEIFAQTTEIEDAYLLKSFLAASFDEKLACFERVLDLNAENQLASSGAAFLRSMQSKLRAPAVEQTPTECESNAKESEDRAEPEDASLAAPDLQNQSEPAEAEAAVEEAEEAATVDYAEIYAACSFESTAAPAASEAENEIWGNTDFENTSLENPIFENTDFENTDFENTALEIGAENFDDDSYSFAPENRLPSYCENDEDVLSLNETSAAGDDYCAETEQQFFAENPPCEIGTGAASEENAASFDFSENVEKAVETDEVEETEEAVETDESDFQTAARQKSFACPFCSRENEPQTIVCPSCRAMLSLSDLETLLAHDGAHREVVRRAIEHLEAEKETRDLSADELKFMGVGQINLKHFRAGLESLRQAVRINPNDVVLGAQVNDLAIRLREIEEQDEIHSSMPKNKIILVVDDSATVRKLISGKLEKSGHAVFCAVDGVDALEKIETLVPDLILLDITMPRMDGYQVCKMIRANEKTREVPVVMISGKDGFFDKVRGRMAGTTGYITKPFGPETLMKTVENYIV